MKLTDIFEADVVDFAQKKKEREFLDKVGAMSKGKADDLGNMAYDIEASEDRDAALAQDVQRKYAREFKAMKSFLARPVMSGGFKSAYDLGEKLYQWRRKNASEKDRRALQKVASDDAFFKQIQQYNALWNAITGHFPMEVIWTLPSDLMDDFEVLEDLFINLGAARHHFLGK